MLTFLLSILHIYTTLKRMNRCSHLLHLPSILPFPFSVLTVISNLVFTEEVFHNLPSPFLCLAVSLSLSTDLTLFLSGVLYFKKQANLQGENNGGNDVPFAKGVTIRRDLHPDVSETKLSEAFARIVQSPLFGYAETKYLANPSNTLTSTSFLPLMVCLSLLFCNLKNHLLFLYLMIARKRSRLDNVTFDKSVNSNY